MIKTLQSGGFFKKSPPLFFMFLLLLFGSNTKAQSFIPDYVFTPTIPGPYVPITTGTVLGSGTVDDDTYQGMNIGFPFVYDNITYTTFSLNANGYIRLGNNMDGSRAPIMDLIPNVLSPITEDLQGTNSGEIRYDTFGIAPNRKLVVQFKDWGFYNRNGSDSFDFQIVLHETTNAIDFIYGRFFKTGDDYVGVGITGNTGVDFINRTTDDDWNATTSSSSQYDQCFLSDAGPIVPFSGLVYTFSPPAKQYKNSFVQAGPPIGVAPGSVDQVVAKVIVTAGGLTSYLPLTSITVNTAGTTNLASVTNIKVYYTGLSSSFSTAVQFGSTITVPLGTNIITDSINLPSGDNYFWITYDIAASATLGGFVDASVPSMVVANTTRIPSVTSPSGNRIIASPMTFISAEATQNLTTKVGRGTANNQILGVTVVTSSSGAATTLTQLDFDATGTTDTADIKNIKVWYTGNNKSFATGAQFGTTLATLPGSMSFSVAGNQTLLNDSNYFWLTYDIVDTAVLTNHVDASCNGMIVGGIGQILSTTSPAGSREIRNDYCTPIASMGTNSCSWGYYISGVVTNGAENNIVNYTGCNGLNTNNYINYSNKTLTVKQNQNISIELGDYSSWITYAVWIDYNQDGAFDNATEMVFQGSPVQNEGYVSGNFTIPCDALTGNTRMRVRGGDWWWFMSPITDACGDIGLGETEDYNVEILSNPISIASIEPTQYTGTVAPGTLNKVILEIPVNSQGCGVAVNTDMKFSTTGTTATSNIVNAKLYRTAKASFNTSNLIGTVASPNGQFSFPLNDTLEASGSTFYWLTYDISASATLSTNIDARLDSIQTLGSYYKPMNGNPSGNILITTPMTYVSSAAIQTMTQKVGRGTSDNEIIGVRVVTSSTGAGINLTQLDFDANGTTDTNNINNIKVWYTGGKNTFSSDNQFGSTLAHLPGTMNFTVTGSQELNNDTNYFWLTYSILDTALITNLVDASCYSLTLNGSVQTPTVTAPVGSREIREEYCEPINSDPINSCNWGYYISAVNTSGAENDLSNYSGCNGDPANNYIYYNDQTLTVKQNQNITINLGDYSSWITYAVWIDYNQDGVFNNTDERVFRGSLIQNEGFQSGSFTIPCNALPGKTRMRIRGGDYWWLSAPISSACADIGLGETEDYEVMILTNPITVSSFEPVQSTGVVAPGTLDKVILKVPVMADGCGVAINTDMKFSTAGSTSAANISNAKLYRTTGTSFNTSNLLGTVVSPSGQFSFTLSDTLVPSGTTNYWLTYDVSGSAVLTNVLDARFDSMNVLGSYLKPLNGNPSGNLQLVAPMTYISSTTTQDNTQKISKETVNGEILAVQVVGSSTGAPLNVTQLDFTANGTTDTSEIENIRVWYTGNNKTFGTTTQFGNTLANLPGSYSFTVTGVQGLANDTNYFWLTYDIKSTALASNVVDGECTGITVGGFSQIPMVTNPAGNRIIKNPSCSPTPGGSPYITNITLGTMNFDPPTNTGINYRVFAPGVATANLPMSNNMTISVTTDGDAVINAWIDFDDDGVFGMLEMIPITMSSGNNPASTTFSVPCTVAAGQYTMRVMSRASGNPNTDPCRAGGSGEAMDFTLTVVPHPIAFDEVTAVQQTGSVGVGVNDQPILRIPVLASGCGAAVATELRFSTTGTTATSNIASAKLYRTGLSESFNTSTLLGTVFSPSGQFSFIINDTLEHNEATNYWLTYDVSPGATLSTVLDARLDSVQVLGAYHTPVTGNPAGNVLISAPMTYLGSTVTQNMTLKVGRGDANNEVIGMLVRTSSAGAPIIVTNFDFNTNGTTDTANLRNLKVWYTGSNKKFGTTTQFGSTLSVLPGTTTFSISGSQALLNDSNYFWLTYDLIDTAAIGNQIDGECTSITIDGNPLTPSVTAPAGSRTIREKYCDPIVSSGFACGNGLYISYVGTTGANVDLDYYSGCSTAPNGYEYYSSVPFVVTQGQSINMTVGDYSSYNTYAVWIDFNQDGIFSTTERVLRTRGTGNWGTLEGSFEIPASAITGVTRMRVRSADYWWFASNINSACLDVGIGQTEDYNIEILPLPAPNVYVWNQTTPADFMDEMNWTPARTTPYANDRLVFNSGGTVQVDNVMTQSVSSITVSNNTTVQMEGANNGTVLTAGDSLKLTSGKIIAGSSLTISVGYDTTKVGTVTGTGSVEGIMRRWINSSTTSYDFPLSNNGNNNKMNLDYTVAPVGGTITARVINGNSNQAGLPLVDGAITINKVSPYGVWRLTAGNGYAGGVFTGTFNAQGVTYVSNQADLRITRRLASIASWTVEGTGVTGTGTIAAPVLGRTGMINLGEFGVGGDVSVNALPVTLTSFSAAPVKNNVLLSWTTVSELNNAGFDIERSVDGKRFTKVGFVKGAGSSTQTINYNDVDENAFVVTNSNTLYYRLRQIDLDGKTHTSEVVSVSRTAKVLSGVNAYPNPFTNGLTIELVSTQPAAYTYSITDIQGKTIFTNTFDVSEGMNRIAVDQVEDLSSGIYFLHIQGDESTTLKVIKTH